ncbi:MULTISPECIES: aspartate aminotransferase family protein [Halolamina]|uniref:Putative [LysW]-aminoadipate semialdehyde/glutamate semialdehyde transaminase n=1 Tax=Halolamina pelagica TaxID=699431 RepID=A0A1I5P3S4_9EURY|nr:MULTISPECIES: aminotransferase class III-fold pyridoxal phosphate-dependent enzyme [Halolamina]NHX36609.1 aminotransferase class III-fold pyridoxal phosphate-dependent enzyme [Halolamina sp. R1-12]SFP28613.1 acetylornithine/LysW-gamma-L-lysine aminotransferase [Halolamina pelagica]
MTGEGFVFSEKPIEIESGAGATLTAADGTEYLDFGASYACTPLGHSPPAVVDAISEQAEDLLYVQGSYPVAARTALQEQLADVGPGDLSKVWLPNSGTEANEAALKFARSATGREKVVVAKRAFHGRTLGALSLTWKDEYRDPFGPLPHGVEFVPYGDAEALADAVDDETAAVFLEPIQGEGGVHPAGDSYLQTAREATEAAGAALVLDEIQTGLGRTGTMWACQSAGVVPDVLTAAKGVASGLPLGVTLCADWIAEGAGNHGSTFAGNPVVAAAAGATLTEIEAQSVPENAARVGEYLRTELRAAVDADDLPVREVRGEGLMIGIEVKRGSMRVLRDLALSEQVLALPAGRSVVRLLPPLTVDEGDADSVVASLVEVLS